MMQQMLTFCPSWLKVTLRLSKHLVLPWLLPFYLDINIVAAIIIIFGIRYGHAAIVKEKTVK